MKKLYKKNEVAFALVWIALFIIVMNIALQGFAYYTYFRRLCPLALEKVLTLP